MGFASNNMGGELKKNKGKQIRIVSGPLVGSVAWLDKVKGKRGKNYHWIIYEDDDDDGHRELESCYVDKWTYVVHKDPTCFLEAAMMQHGFIEKDIEALARSLARVKIAPNSPEITTVISKKLERAYKRQSKKKIGTLSVSWSDKNDMDQL